MTAVYSSIGLLTVLLYATLWSMADSTNHTRHTSTDISAEKRLIRRLMNKYEKIGKSGRPVRNVSDIVPVVFGLGLIQMSLDEKDKILVMSMWTRMKWKDEYLMWDPEKYQGVKKIRLYPRRIWKPDIILLNTADIAFETRDVEAEIDYDGNVNWYPHCIFRSSCSVDITNFPFDRQQCNMVFGSWTHTTKEISLNMSNPEGIDLGTWMSESKDYSAWDVDNVKAQRVITPPGLDGNQFTVLTFELHLRRKIVFASYMLILPCVFLALLSVVVFLLPPERPDRTSLALSGFGSFMVLLLILVEAAPPTASSIPMLGVYYCFNMVIIMLSIVLSSLVINVSRSVTGKRVPAWARCVFFKVIARVICLSMPSKDMAIIDHESGKSKRRRRWCCACPCRLYKNDKTDANGCPEMMTLMNRQHEEHQEADNTHHLLETEILKIRHSLERLQDQMDKKRKQERDAAFVVREWKTLAAVLDRLFLVVYVVLIGVSLTMLLPRPT